jgi:nucleoside-diphosphate-sugar epimerase
MRALVIGGPGFIGAATCKELMRRGVETIAASRTPHPYGTFTSHVAFDRGDEEELARVLAEKEPDVVVDLALTGVAEADWLAGHFGGRHVVATCVDGVELDPTAGRRVVIRSGRVIGGGDHQGNRLAGFLRRLEESGPEGLREPHGGEPPPLCWVRDFGFALALAADESRPVEGRRFDVGFEDADLDAVEAALASALGRRLEWVDDPAAPADRQRGFDLEPAKRDLGFRPSAVEDCLAEVMAFHRASGRPGQPARE